MYECFHCGEKTVIWDADYDTSDYGIARPGIIHTCHCTNCGAEIEYYIFEEEDEGDVIFQ